MTMNKRTLIITTAITSAVIAATSFAITATVTGDSSALPLDAPIAVPQSTTEEATVLAPVAQGDSLTAVGAADFSDELGSLAVTVPAESPGEGATPPGIVAAAAALDVLAGDVTFAPLTSDDASGSEAPSEPPTEGEEGTAPSPASDPCAVSPDAEACPEGLTATLFSLDTDGTLNLYATADPVTGPGMGSSIWCDAAATEDGALRLGALTSDPATVSITYWPQDRPTERTTVELASVGSGGGTWVRHCGVSLPLGDGRYEGTAIALSPTGVISAPYPLDFDSRGRPTVPNMKVVPLGTNWLWVGVYHAVGESALIDSYPLIDGGATSCSDAADPRWNALRIEIGAHTSAVPSTWLRARNYNEAYTRVTSALLYVPEGTSAGICGQTYTVGEPVWEAGVPERTQFTTVAAPDSWEAVVTVRDVSVYQPGSVDISARGALGQWCGSSTSATIDAPRSDTATTTTLDAEICALAGQNIVLTVNSFFNTEAGGSGTDEATARFAVMGANCTGDCPQPEDRSYRVYIPGLGQDQCPDRSTDDCELRRRVAGAYANLDVTWRQGGDGARDRWGIGGVSDVTVADTPSDSPRFDTDATMTATLDPSGFTATGSIRLRWDRQVDYQFVVHGTCFNEEFGAEAPAAITGTSTPSSAGVYVADVRVRGLCAGSAYWFEVRYTDGSGVTYLAAPEAETGLSPDTVWSAGYVIVPHLDVEVTAKVEVLKEGRVDSSFQVSTATFEVGYQRFSSSFGPTRAATCFAGTSATAPAVTDTVELARTYVVEPIMYLYTDWYYYPPSYTCDWRRSDRWTPESASTVSLGDLLEGVVIEGDFAPELPTSDHPFTYRITLTGEMVEGD